MALILTLLFTAAFLPFLSDAAPNRFKRQSSSTQCSKSYSLPYNWYTVSVNAVSTCYSINPRYPNYADWTFTFDNLQSNTYGSQVYVNVNYTTQIEAHSYCSWDKLVLGYNLNNPVTICGYQSGSFSVLLQSWESKYVVRFTSDSSINDYGFSLVVSRSNYAVYRTTNLPQYLNNNNYATTTPSYYSTTGSYYYNTTGVYYYNTTYPYYYNTTYPYYYNTTYPYYYNTTFPYYYNTTGSYPYYNTTYPYYYNTTGSYPYYNTTSYPYYNTTGSYPYYNTTRYNYTTNFG